MKSLKNAHSVKFYSVFHPTEEEKSSGSKVSRFFKSAFGGGGGQSSKSTLNTSKTSSVSQSTISLATDGSTYDLTSKKQMASKLKSRFIQ